jgi:hypothetical protein
MRLNRGGLLFCAVYACWFLALSGLAITTNDSKGAYFLAQMSILPAQLFLWTSPVGNFLEAHFSTDSLVNSGFMTVPLSFVVVYLIGWGLSALRGLIRPRATPVEKDSSG